MKNYLNKNIFLIFVIILFVLFYVYFNKYEFYPNPMNNGINEYNDKVCAI